MSLFVRTLLTWLLVCAVPAQGFAAATMAFCGPNHHGHQAAATDVADAHSHHADRSTSVLRTPEFAFRAAGQAHAEPLHDSGGPAVAQVTGDASALAKPVHAAEPKCSACAACCSLGAFLTSVPGIPAADPAPTVFLTVVPTVDAFAADGPDRPPRTVLA